MSALVLAIRPEPGLAATMAAGEALGLTMIGYPLFELRPCEWEAPAPGDIDALLIGSANALRYGGKQLDALKGKPVHAVGRATADAARAYRFAIASEGAGGLQNVLDQIPPPSRLLRLAGREHVDLTVPDGITITTAIAYESCALELPEQLKALQDLSLTVLLHSGKAAEHFAAEAARLALDRARITIAALAPRIAAAAGTGWRAIHVSPVADDRHLLDMVAGLCIREHGAP